MEMEASSKGRGGKSPSRKHLLCKELAASVKGVSVKYTLRESAYLILNRYRYKKTIY